MDRLQKVLAQAGISSRRKCEELILSGRVTVDGKVCTELGTKVNPAEQRVAVDGVPIAIERKLCIVLYKPTSYVTTVRDPEGRRTVMELVGGIKERLYPVGRLDYDTSGLLLLTNDGELANRLLHPRHGLEKVYRATVIGMIDEDAITRLTTGVRLEDGLTAPAQVVVLRKHPRESVLELTIHEGRHRQVRRMLDAVGFPIKRLKRIQFGPIHLQGVRLGEWRLLTPEEWRALYSAAELSPPPYPVAVPSTPAKIQGRPKRATARKRRH